MVVVAGPGTGKTATLVARMIAMLEQDRSAPVALITFTRLSRRGTYRDITKKVAELSEKLPDTDVPRIATVHTFAKGIVHTYAAEAGLHRDFHVLVEDMGETKIIVVEACEDLSLAIPLELICKMLAEELDSGVLVPPPGLSAEDARRVSDRFDALCRFYNAIDIRALVTKATQVISAHRERLANLCLHVDEYQDLNAMDQELVRCLARDASRQVVCVGDDAQSIYGFRHAHAQGIQELFADKGWEPLQFTECVRLPEHILRSSQQLLQRSTKRYLGSATVPTIAADSNRVPLTRFTGSDIELKGVIAKLMHLKDNGRKRNGQSLEWKDMMVLCPSGTIVTQFSRELEHAGIPTKVRTRFQITPAQWNVLLLLRLGAGDDALALRQCLSIVGMDAPTMAGLRRDGERAGVSLFEPARRSSNQTIALLLQAINLLRQATAGPEVFLNQLQAVPGIEVTPTTLQDLGLTVEALGEGRVRPRNLLGAIYEHLGLFESGEDISDEDRVLVTTVHSSKGLEAEFVFVVRLDARLMPQPGRDPEEQRRVFYVAMTRAKQQLFFSYHERWDPNSKRRLTTEARSPFLNDILATLDETRVAVKDVATWASAG